MNDKKRLLQLIKVKQRQLDNLLYEDEEEAKKVYNELQRLKFQVHRINQENSNDCEKKKT